MRRTAWRAPSSPRTTKNPFWRLRFSTATRYPASGPTARGSVLDDPRQVWRHSVGAHWGDRDGGVGSLHHLAVPHKHRDALAAFGAVEDQVTGQRLRRQDLAADLVLLARGSRQLDPDTGECVNHETRRVESDPADPRLGGGGDRCEVEADVAGQRIGAEAG